jgi:flagellar biosynthesis protein FlhF
MNPQKFLAPNVTEALKLVTQQLGGEAIVLTTRDTAQGVEIIAITPGDLALLSESRLDASGGLKAPAQAPTPSATPESMKGTPFLKSPSPLAQVPVAAAAKAVSAAEMDHLLAEFAQVKQLLQTHLSEKVWGEMQEHSPRQAEALRLMLHAGFSPSLSADMVKAIPAELPSPVAVQQALLQQIETRLQVVDPLSVFDPGGIFAFVGPTGVGKTTAIAKIAARCVLRYGRDQLALLTTDTFRIGAQEQLQVYAKIIGVPVATLRDSEDLAAKIKTLGQRHIVLLDTTGVNQRDIRMLEQSQLLQQGAPELKRILVVSSTTDLRTQEDVILMHQQAARSARGGSILAALITKTDEAAQLGPAVDCLIRHQLPLMFLANGQRVPEDLSPANLPYLSHRALHPRTLGDDMALGDHQLPALMADQLSQWKPLR